MIPKIDSRVQPTLCEITEETTNRGTKFSMKMEGDFTDKLGWTFSITAEMTLDKKLIDECGLMKLEKPERDIALRKFHNWKILTSSHTKANP